MENRPAFPCAAASIDGATHLQEGMTLRQYYASQALIGYLSSHADHQPKPEQTAAHCFSYADAMIAFEKDEEKC